MIWGAKQKDAIRNLTEEETLRLVGRTSPAKRKNRRKRVCRGCSVEKYTRLYYSTSGPDVCVECVPMTTCVSCGIEHRHSGFLCADCSSTYISKLCCGCHAANTEASPVLLEDTFSRRDDGHLLYCSSCIESMASCDHCQKSIFPKEYHTIKPFGTDKEIKVCHDCFHYECSRETCGKCHSLHYVMNGHGQNINRGYLFKCSCPECDSAWSISTGKCEYCGKDDELVNTPYATDNYKKMCSYCSQRLIWGRCASCSEPRQPIGTKGHHDRYDTFYCEDCIGKPVYDWRFHRVPNLIGNGTLFYGIENEYDFFGEEYREQSDRLRREVSGREDCFLVHDGSLNYGMELVLDGRNFQAIMDKSRPLLPKMENLCKENAGLHVHLSKAAFTTNHMWRFMTYLSAHKQLFTPIFGRDTSYISPRREREYCREMRDDLVAVAKCKGRMRDDKYVWLNVSDVTIECRLFQAVTTNEELRTCIQFLDSIYHYTQKCSNTSLGEIMPYINMVLKESKYRLLANFIKERILNGFDIQNYAPALPERKQNTRKTRGGSFTIPSYEEATSPEAVNTFSWEPAPHPELRINGDTPSTVYREVTVSEQTASSIPRISETESF